MAGFDGFGPKALGRVSAPYAVLQCSHADDADSAGKCACEGVTFAFFHDVRVPCLLSRLQQFYSQV